jgi:hypothetical protein
MVIALLWAAPLLAWAVSVPGENSVKAAFVFNFLRFTEWPAQRFANRNSDLTLCVWLANTHLSESLRHLAGRFVDQRNLRVTEIDQGDELGRCHALFVPEAAQRLVPEGMLRRAESQNVLTVGDAENFAAAGGMIGLVAEGARMRFELNDKAVKRSAIKLSSQLYQLGRLAQENPLR